MIFLQRKQFCAKTSPKMRRLPPMLFEIIMLITALAVVVSMALYAQLDWKSLAFGKLKQVQLVGEYKRMDRLQLENIFEPVIGQHLMSLDLSQFEQQLEDIPWVKRVTITRVWPDQLSVRIEERQAVARWQERGLIDQSGEVFFPETAEHLELPLFITGAHDNADALSFYYYLSEAFYALNSRITHIIKDAPRSWKIAFQEGFVITLGQHDVEHRIQRFVKAYQYSLHDIKEHIQCVDLRYPDGFSIRWKKKRGQSLC